MRDSKGKYFRAHVGEERHGRGATPPIIDGITAAYTNTTAGLPGFLLEPFQGATKPSAFINYILFDENYKPIEAKSTPVGATAATKALIALPTIAVKETGHLFVYLSYDNESTQLVYWDDLTIKVTESPVVQVNNYYPYGLVATEWVREGETDNNFLYQGKELIDKTGWQDFGARMYDGPTGRWFSNDPARQFASGYLAMGNNPVMMTDPDGQWAGWDDAIVMAAGFAYGYVSSGIKTGDWGKKSVIQGGITAALFEIGYLTGGASAGLTATSSNAAIATAGASYAAQSVVTGAVGQLLPSVPIVESEKFNLSISPAFAWGTNGIQAGASLNASGRIGDTEISGSASGFATWKGFGSNAKGWNAQFGGGVKQHFENGSISLYSTTFRGSNKKYNQSVGGFGFSVGEYSVRVENDFLPGGDGGDRYRTAAVQGQYRNYVAGFKLFTGDPDDGIGNRRKHNGGYALGNKPSAGVLYGGVIINGQLYSAGWNSSGIKQGIQNNFHKFYNAVLLRNKPNNEKLGMFYDRNTYSRPYFNYSSLNPFSLY
jgi:RHS repeat-associated protein